MVYEDAITLPLYCQAEKKFAARDSFLPFINTIYSRTRLWRPQANFPKLILQSIPNVLEPLKSIISLRELPNKLNVIGKVKYAD